MANTFEVYEGSTPATRGCAGGSYGEPRALITLIVAAPLERTTGRDRVGLFRKFDNQLGNFRRHRISAIDYAEFAKSGLECR